MEIELSVKISEEDFVDIKKEIYYKNSVFSKWLHKIGPYVVIALLCFIITKEVESGISIIDSLYGNVWIVFVVIGAFFVPQLLTYLFRIQYRSNKSILDTLYSIDNELIEVKTSLFEVKIFWKAIIQVQELSNWFILKPNKLNFYALPKNQLNPSQQAWLRHKVTKK